AHARAQRVVLEAAYVTYAAGVVVLPEGQVVAHVGDDVRGVGSQGICLQGRELGIGDAVAAVGLAIADLAVQIQHEAATYPPVVVGLGAQLPVLHGGARQGDIGGDRHQTAAARGPVLVAGVMGPAQRAGP